MHPMRRLSFYTLWQENLCEISCSFPSFCIILKSEKSGVEAVLESSNILSSSTHKITASRDFRPILKKRNSTMTLETYQ